MLRALVALLLRAVGGAGLAGFAVGCAAAPPAPDLGGIYGRAARHHDARRNPVVLIPGILGSKLRLGGLTGQVVWGAFTSESADPETPEGARALAHPLARGRALLQATDRVVPAGVLDRLHVDLLGLPLELSAYVGILRTLGVGGYRDEALGRAGAVDYGEDHYTCFQLDYDWRRDCAEQAARLDAFLRARRAYVEAENAKRGWQGPVKFDVVAHSMGGVVLRWYLMYGTAPLPLEGPLPEPTWAGAELVERAILVGTPSAGSVLSLAQLVDGVRFSALLPEYPPALVGTFPSVYQLLPRGRHGAVVDARGRPIGDLLDPALWERNGWGLADPAQAEVLARLLPDVADPAERRRIALEHLRLCLLGARRFQEALDRPARPPEGLELFLVAGDAVETPARLAVGDAGRVRVTAVAPGDGTVPRQSALMDERAGRDGDEPHLISPVPWRQVAFVFTDHLEMTRDPAFTDQVLWWLLEDPRGEHRKH